jgi:sulfur-carrier protein
MTSVDAAMIQVRVRFFASLREALGAEQTATLPRGSTVGSLREALMASSAEHAQRLAPQRAVRAALNQTLCAESAGLANGDEVAFFPPVTGG